VLFSIDQNQYVDEIPYEKDHRRWRAALTDGEYDSIIAELKSRISGGEIHTSIWIPGADWAGTVYDPIYRKACNYDSNAAALCFGLFLWVVLMEHHDTWGFGRYAKDGVPIRGLTYFKIANPPPRRTSS
jgi:hypothetical protein